jgi:protocatechuate 3,4-dioxygenase beta subunit
MEPNINRRQILKNSFLAGASGIAAVAGVSGIARAEELCSVNGATPAQTEGPFYPITAHADLDADLTILKGQAERARGEVVDIWIKVQDENCQPIAGALVDLWQACATGKYDHPNDPNEAEVDPLFQYWAKVLTNSKGYVKVRTIKPGAYPANETWYRPPHIHFKISGEGFQELTTQMYFAGEALNKKDLILLNMAPSDRSKVTVRFTRAKAESLPTGIFTVTLKGLVES